MPQAAESSSPRMVSYLALAAGAVPAGDAMGGGVIGESDLGLVADPFVERGEGWVGAIADLSLGASFGTVRFQASAASFTYIHNYSAQSALAMFHEGGSFTAGSFLGTQVERQRVFPRRLASGFSIDGDVDAPWTHSAFLAASRNSRSDFYNGGGTGEWLPEHGDDAVRGFLAFRITNDGGESFLLGWFDVEYDLDDPGGKLTIHGWALNTTPNQGIFAGGGAIPSPSPAALALLAAGAAGMRRTRWSAALAL